MGMRLNFYPIAFREEIPETTKTTQVDEKYYNYDFVKTEDDVNLITLPYGYVTDGVLSSRIHWHPYVPIGIFADTGTGKNTFLESCLIHTVMTRGGRIVLFTNRVALGRQVKRRIAHLLNLDKLVASLSDEGLDDQTEFGCVTIISYQQLEYWVRNKRLDRLHRLIYGNYTYVVCDEVHYFTSDASFNGSTNLALDFIVENFQNSMRIYMTATPEEIFPILKNAEYAVKSKRLGYIPKRIMWNVYEFEHEYSYLNVRGFSDKGDMIDWMKESKEKFIVFIEDKDTGSKIVSELGKDARMITAESKMVGKPGYETYAEIVEKETFSCRVLVTTAVLENGVNLRGRDINNIVIFCNDKTKFLQMIGRVRRETDQMINLFIADVSYKKIKKNYIDLQTNKDAYELYQKNPSEFGSIYLNNRNPRCSVMASTSLNVDSKFNLNHLAYEKLAYFDLPQWERWLIDSESGTKYAALREKFSWVQCEFEPKCMIPEKRRETAINKFNAFLEEHVDVALDKEKQADFKKNITLLHDAAYGRREESMGKGDKDYGADIIKQLLEKLRLPYTLLTTEDTKNGTWRLSRREEG